MRRVWDAGLYPEPAQFQMLSSLWSPQNVVWTEKWLRMLRTQSAVIVEDWQQLRRKELTEAAERERQGAIGRFYTGGELRRLLHPRAPAPHSPLLQTTLPDTLKVTGGSHGFAKNVSKSGCLFQAPAAIDIGRRAVITKLS